MMTSVEAVQLPPRYGGAALEVSVSACLQIHNLPTKMEKDRRRSSSIVGLVRLWNGDSSLAVIDFAVDYIGEHAIYRRTHYLE